MKKIKKFIKWYLKANEEYYAQCLKHRANPFLH